MLKNSLPKLFKNNKNSNKIMGLFIRDNSAG